MRNLKKTILETFFAIAITAIIELSCAFILEHLTIAALITRAWGLIASYALLMLIGDAVFKFVYYPQMIWISATNAKGKKVVKVIWQYWVGFFAILGAIALFRTAQNTDTYLMFALHLAGATGLSVLAALWDAKVYNYVIIDPNEYESEILKNFLAKLPPNVTADEVKAKLSTFLRFNCKGDDLEGGLDFDCALNTTFATLDEMKKQYNAVKEFNAKAVPPQKEKELPYTADEINEVDFVIQTLAENYINKKGEK